MTSTDQQLGLFRLPREHANVRWLVALLKQRGWTTRKEILVHIGWPQTESNLRHVRELVAAAGPEIVKGQRGFNHFENCTLAEIKEARKQSMNFARENLRYAIGLQRRMYQHHV